MGWGTLDSFETHLPHSQINGFRYPLQVSLVELEECTRVAANLIGLSSDQLTIGMPLEV